MADGYESFWQLSAEKAEGVAWVREYRPRGSGILVMAPHGGWIESYTTELARAMAGEDLSFYTFQGLEERVGGRVERSLHITSHRFDEPLALRAAAEAEAIMAVHGERTRDRPFVMVGGRWEELRERLHASLEGAGFTALEPRRGLWGRDPRNICNRGRSGQGGQVEVSEELRQVLRRDGGAARRFVEAVREILLPMEKGLSGRPGGAAPLRGPCPPQSTEPA